MYEVSAWCMKCDVWVVVMCGGEEAMRMRCVMYEVCDV